MPSKAAATLLGRTHPTLHIAITDVERQMGFPPVRQNWVPHGVDACG